MEFSGYTLGMIMRVLCAEGPLNAINHSINDNCELRKREHENSFLLHRC